MHIYIATESPPDREPLLSDIIVVDDTRWTILDMLRERCVKTGEIITTTGNTDGPSHEIRENGKLKSYITIKDFRLGYR